MSADAYLPTTKQLRSAHRRAKKVYHEKPIARVYACECGREIPEARTYCRACEAVLSKKNKNTINAQKLAGLLRLDVSKMGKGKDE